MGLFTRISWSYLDKPERIIERETIITYRPLPNPKPDNYKILRHQTIGKGLVIEIQYLDCTNYEGKKILVFKNCTLADLINQKLIDPHFSENKKFHSPIARFAPTQEGWSLAFKCLKEIEK